MRLRYLPPDSATQTVLREGRPYWGVAEDIAEQTRIISLAKAGVKNPAPHWASPVAAILAEQRAAEVERRAALIERKKLEIRRREAERLRTESELTA